MKVIVPWVGMIAIIGIGLYLIPSTHEVINDVIVEEKVVEVTPDWASDEDAVRAAKDVIRRKELEAELTVVDSEIKTLEVRKIEIEKELGSY